MCGRGWSAPVQALNCCRPGGTRGLRTCLGDGQRRWLSHLRDPHRPSLWCWGDDRYGQLGVGDTKRRAVPTQVGTSTDWVGLVAGNAHTCATRSDHTLWCWGWNRDGQLGIDSKNLNRTTPTRVGTGTNWAEVSAAGIAHTCGIRTDDTLWCWGFNSTGQLGLGDNTNQNSPTPGRHRHHLVHVTAGDGHTCATRADAPCGAGETTSAVNSGSATTRTGTTPTRVGTSTDWANVSAGKATTPAPPAPTTPCGAGDSTAAVSSGSATPPPGPLPPRSAPAQTGTSSVAGHRHTCATRTDHSLWCWGDNELWPARARRRHQPDRPNPGWHATDWADVSAGARHTCATRTDHTLWCWGDNTSGQLGLGDQTARLAPTLV